MTKPFELYKEPIQVAQGYNLLAYKRDGILLNASPIEEYVRLTASGVAGNQTAVFDLDTYGIDLMPEVMVANFLNTTGNITYTVLYRGQTTMTFTVNGNTVVDGVALPKIPISHENTELRIHTTAPCSFIWVSAKQCTILQNIAQSYFI